MVEFKPSSGEIVLPGGRIVSVQRAKRLITQLENAVEMAEAYENAEEIHDVGTNEMAVKHLLNPSDADHLMVVELSHEDDADLAKEYFVEVLDRGEGYALVDARVQAKDIRKVFDESTGITGFHVSLPDSERS